MCWKNDAGNVTCLSTGGGTIPTGSGGVAGAVAFWTSATTLGADDPHFHWDDANDQLLIGINTGSHLGTDSGLLVDKDASSSIIGTVVHSATANQSGALNLLRSRGTHALPTVVASGDKLMRLVAQGYDGAAYRDAAALDINVDGTPGSSDMPGRIVFFTTPDGSTTLTERWRINNVGFLGSGGIDPVGAIDVRGTGSPATTIAGERDNGQVNFIGYRVRGGGTATQANDFLSLFFGGGSHSGASADRATTAGMGIKAGENWTATAKGAYITLETTPLLSVTRAERFRVGPSGQWGIEGANFGTAGNLFQSGGASAAPSWLDHTTDFLSQYALLAGRSGGQTLKGGTAASENLTLMSTNHATKGKLLFGTSAYDEVNNRLGLLTASPDATIHIGGSVSSVSVFHMNPTHTATGSIGLFMDPDIRPAASSATIICGFLGTVNPQAGVAISEHSQFYNGPATGSGAGTVGVLNGGRFAVPTYGSVKPTTARGIQIDNYGASGITDAIGIMIDAQSGATNNYDLGFSRNDTTAAGSYFGRIPVRYNGALKYLHVFNT